MKRSARMGIAKETVGIVDRGLYQSAKGKQVNIKDAVSACLRETRLYSPEDLEELRKTILAQAKESREMQIEVVNETTLSGIFRLASEGCGRIAVLNFASAKNPGGGFLNGSEAQEESLARSSALHASQFKAWDFYEKHRASPSLLYSDSMIASPGCPVIRDDEGQLLEEPRLVDFITSPAPNAGAAVDSRPEDLPLIPETFRRRSEYVLALAAAMNCDSLVLGAWGCGVFRNDPAMVAGVFRDWLNDDVWRGRFKRVRFSVLDRSAEMETFKAFERAFA
ncbi:TIGR02452 family protein [Haloferula sp. BvORR071]|uniref:TIGR02452 family protein n=1 Tax=Haloferula sp. BvORR071 TaxID=1396141 RepID=UPI000551698C|nr:TIGR02452 family protein [Haloferula sp. BvORR071]